MVAKKMSLYLARVSTFSTVFLGINTLIFALFLTSTPLLAAMWVKNGLYKINKAVLYHSSDLQNVDVVQLVLTYRVQDAKIKAIDFLKDGTALTDEFVDEVLMLAERVKSYQNKRAREEEKKKKEEAERLAEQKEREEALKKNKWA